MLANEVKKFTTLVVLRHNLEFQEPYKIWHKNSRSSHFALQIAFFLIFCTSYGKKKKQAIPQFLRRV